MTNDISIKLDNAYYVRSLISYYPLSHSILPVPDGLSVVIFESKEHINEYFQLRGVTDTEEFEILTVNSFYDFMREVAEIGFIGVWFFKKFPILFCNYIADIDLELPSLAYIPDNLFIGASGKLEPLKHFEKWRNYYKTDKIIRRNVRFIDGTPFNPQDSVYTIIAVDNNPVVWDDACPLKGPYVSDLGAYSMFTTEEHAMNYIQSKGLEGNSDYQIEKLEDTLKFLDIVNSNFPFIDIGVNPGNERYLQGYFFKLNERWVLRTVFGNYFLEKRNFIGEKLEIENLLIDDTVDSNDRISVRPKDTIGSPNVVDSSLREIKSTIKYPLKQIFGSTTSPPPRIEAVKIIEKLTESSKYKEDVETWSLVIEANDISIESFLIFGFDKVNGYSFSNNEEMITPYIFTDITDAILYFYHHYYKFEYELRLNGYSLCHRNVMGSKNEELESEILSHHRAALKGLLETIITHGYKAEHAELLKLYLNRTCGSLEIEECGYLGDLAIYQEPYIESYNVDDESPITQKIMKSTNKYRNKIRNNIGFDEKFQNKIRIFLGNSYNNLSVDSLCILESTIKQYENTQQRINHDYAGISMKLCKVFERELNIHIFKNWRDVFLKGKTKADVKRIEKVSNQNIDETMKRISSWLLKKRKLELGPMTFIIKRLIENCDNEVLTDLKEYILNLKNHKYILSEDFLKICKLISTRFRNGGVHEHIVTYEICKEAFNEILEKDDNCLKLLANV